MPTAGRNLLKSHRRKFNVAWKKAWRRWPCQYSLMITQTLGGWRVRHVIAQTVLLLASEDVCCNKLNNKKKILRLYSFHVFYLLRIFFIICEHFCFWLLVVGSLMQSTREQWEDNIIIVRSMIRKILNCLGIEVPIVYFPYYNQ